MPRKGTRKATMGQGARTGKTQGAKGGAAAVEQAPTPSRGTAVEPLHYTKPTQQRSAPTHEQIALRAQEIWKQRGCPHGRDEQHWHEAEEQLKQEMSVP